MLLEREDGGICVQCISTAADLGRPLPPEVPQRTDHLGRRDVVGVVRDQSQQERAVRAYVVDDELTYQVAVIRRAASRRQTTAKQQVVADELETVLKQNSAQQPHHEADDTSQRHGDHPEPEEHVDLLVVEVNGQYTLDGVGLNVAEVLSPHAQVAQGDSWERDVAVLGPVDVRDETTQQVDTERRVASRQDSAENEQLTDDVDDVAQLGEEEQHHQVVAKSTHHSNRTAASK